MSDISSKEYTLLKNIEQKTVDLSFCSCLLSLNAMSMSVAIDACRLAKYFELLLSKWSECLPLGDAIDVNFPLWGDKMWEIITRVRYAYSLNKVDVNQYEFEADSFLQFKQHLSSVDVQAASMEPFVVLGTRDGVATATVCALRELNEVLMRISEFLNSPTEELISSSFRQWEECYRKQFSRTCHSEYNKWKIQYSPRTLRKNLLERMNRNLADFREMFLTDAEFELVYDAEQKRIDLDGLSRFLFTHVDRFGVSLMGGRPTFSKELLRLFNFVETWSLMQADLQPGRRRQEKSVELEQKVMALVGRVDHLAAEGWRDRLPALWRRLLSTFHSEIARAGSHEKFKEFSKKTVYCILGHLKSVGVYSSVATNVDYTRLLEGTNNGMRKYVTYGLSELDVRLKKRIAELVEAELVEAATVRR